MHRAAARRWRLTVKAVLDEQKAKARESLREASALFTRPSDEGDTVVRLPYTLRGISTDAHITYVLHPVEDGTESAGFKESQEKQGDMDAEIEGQSERVASSWQWWRVDFSPSNSKPVSKMASQPVSFDPVAEGTFALVPSRVDSRDSTSRREVSCCCNEAS